MTSLVLLTVAGFGGFAVLVSVAPLWVVHGGADEVGAGLVTAVLLLLTVITQTFVPWLLNRFGHGPVLAAGLLALGLPSLLYGLSDQLLPVLVLSAVRGVGFGILTVTGSAVVADLVPMSRRGEAIGVYGLGIALPNLAFLPASVVVADGLGFWWVFVAGAMPVLGVPAGIRLGHTLRRQQEGPERPNRAGETGPSGDDGSEDMARDGRRVLLRVSRPALVLLCVTLAGGGLMTFLPQVTDSGALSSLALLVLGVCAAVSRWWIGRVADQRGAGRLLAPLLALSAVGLVLTALSVRTDGSLWLLVPAVGVVGLGYGALQNLTLVTAFAQVTQRHFGTASAVWNIGFDAGTAAGALLLGVVASGAGFATGFVVMAVLVCAAAPLGWSLRRA